MRDMLRKIKSTWFILCVTFSFQQAHASASRVIDYMPNKVYSLNLSPLYATAIKLKGIKKIASIHCGDADAWEILTRMDSPNVLIIKPRAEHSKTDLLVHADQYDLIFKIQSKPFDDSDPLLFVTMMFSEKHRSVSQPGLETDFLSTPSGVSDGTKTINRYCYRGDPLLRPSWVYDNNNATYFHWSKYSPTPAIYRVSPDGQEKHMVNFRVKQRIFRVPIVSNRWLFKKGIREGHLIYFDPQRRRCDG